MATSYDQKIKIAEAESKLAGQHHGYKRIEIEIMKHKRKVEEYEKELVNLSKEIVISEQELEKVKGGE
jgi:hypothetical protein